MGTQRVPVRSYTQKPAYDFPRKYPSDGTYAEAIEAFIIVCTDIIPINREQRCIFLAKRKVKPMSGWWWIGGRIYPGEAEEVAAARNFRRETSLVIDPSRFELVQMNRLICNEREQLPQDKGIDYLIYAFAVELADEEIAAASQNMEEKEYEGGLVKFSYDDMIRVRLHRSIINFYDQVF